MRPLAAVVLGAAALALAGGAAWWALREEPPAESGETDSGAGVAPRPGGRAAVPAGEPGESAEPETPAPAVGAPRARPVAAPDPFADETAIPEPGEAVPGRGLVFRFPGYGAADEVDWLHVGIGVRRGRRLVLEAARRVTAGEDLGTDPAAFMDAAQLAIGPAAPLCRAINELDHDTEGAVSRILAHPAFESNAMAGALEAWGLGLRPEQVDALRKVWDAHLVRWSDVRFRPGATRWGPAALVAVTRSRRDAEARIEEILDDRQRAALRPAEFRGRVGMDFFSPATVWWGRVRVVQAPDDAALTARIAEVVVSETRMREPEMQAVLRDLVAKWVAERTPAWRRGARGPLSRNGFVTETELYPGVDALPALLDAIDRRYGIGDRPDSPLLGLTVAIVPARAGD
jgi:hypothetical protein